ncbi:unnamed protein product [marine sediment metagenome]|uniref:Uncharacterized protein n=1 Tax=marine sediment metagenome TaxID=412755 RepID=X1D8H3_9ZZZZ
MNKWYGFNFKINWPDNQDPKVWIDIFIIGTIVRDVISKKKSEIDLWRIHRRWPSDEHRHEVTFDCFADKETATSIEKLIRESETFKILQANNLLAGDLKKVTGGSNIHDIADDDSTRDWSEELKESWPYYINGCSEMFLFLIESLKGRSKTDVDEKNISEIESFYTELNNRISEIWQRHGSHAFFHHINAIFGYEPLLAKPRSFAGILASF